MLKPSIESARQAHVSVSWQQWTSLACSADGQWNERMLWDDVRSVESFIFRRWVQVFSKSSWMYLGLLADLSLGCKFCINIDPKFPILRGLLKVGRQMSHGLLWTGSLDLTWSPRAAKLWRCSPNCGPHCCGEIPDSLLLEKAQPWRLCDDVFLAWPDCKGLLVITYDD